MILTQGDTILVVHRRLFADDEILYFIGAVDAYESGMAKATGHSFLWDQSNGVMVEKNKARTKILALCSGLFLVHLLPAGVVFDALQFAVIDGSLTLSDGDKFAMNLAEHTHEGRA